MSPKVQHIPPSGHLSTASLALLMAGQSLTTQYLSGVDIRGLVLADIAASLLLVLVCGTRFLRIVSLLQGLLSLFCLSYAASMGMPPTLAAILNGSRQIAGMDLRSLWTILIQPPLSLSACLSRSNAGSAVTSPVTVTAGWRSSRPALCWQRSTMPACSSRRDTSRRNSSWEKAAPGSNLRHVVPSNTGAIWVLF